MNNKPILYLVIPCYNEQDVLPETIKRVSDKLARMEAGGIISKDSRILFVDDGSKDATWQILEEAFAAQESVCAMKLAHNRGHQRALLAGLMTAREHADCVISMDADLQDDIEVLDLFVEKYTNGCDIVYGVRKQRKKDTAFKRSSAKMFYKFMRLLGTEILPNHADYRLMSRRALDALSKYDESNIFLRGMIPDIGYKSDIVYYDRHERFAGKSKYPLKKMMSFAIDGITSFSVKPLTIISNVGIIISFLSVLGLVYALVSKLCFESTVAGWTAIVASIWLLGGIQLFCIGIIGCYIGKIFSEVKNRPKYITEILLKK